jgi:hypothetical protein
MRLIHGLAVVMILAAHACSREPSPSHPLQGEWRMATFPMPVPDLCFRSSIAFRGDTLVARSGAQVDSSEYSAEPSGVGFLVELRHIRVSGGPNCQGLSADHVMRNHASQVYVKISGDSAWFGDGAAGPFATMIRTR